MPSNLRKDCRVGGRSAERQPVRRRAVPKTLFELADASFGVRNPVAFVGTRKVSGRESLGRVFV
jgi:hypothetical protein